MPRGSKSVLPPKQTRLEAVQPKQPPPIVTKDPLSSVPHATPADVPVTYEVQRSVGNVAAFGGANIAGAPAIGAPATAFQLAAACGALWFLASKLGK